MADPVTTVLAGVATSVISSILNNLATRALNEPESSGDINSIKFKLGAAQSYLGNVSRLKKHQVQEIERVAYCAEEAIEKILWLQQRRRDAGFVGSLLRYNHYHSKYRKTIRQINEEFQRLGDLIPGIFECNLGESTTTNQFGGELSEDPRERLYTIGSHEVVGFENLTKEIIKELEECPSNDQNLGVVSIFGMGGIGKSTLAKKVFDKAEHFPIKVWITVSQQYNVLNLRKEILKSIVGPEEMEKVTDNDVCDKLYKTLEVNRYLIVLDDIWETKSWDDIFYLRRELHDNTNSPKSIFPDINNASRIIVTTRKLPVAKQPNIKTFVHEVEPLGDEEGWKLLKKKALPSHVSISEPLKSSLESLGPEIAKKSKGLPLALVVLGGYLSKHLDYETWNKMGDEDVNWKEAGGQINISKILALSYDDLPNELKPIFLYITSFPEDSVIESEDLIKLWIAEGFIPPPKRNYKLEKTARFYLRQLYERGLVQVVKRSRAHKRIEAIRIHDVLRDWGIEKGKEDGFFKVISNCDNATPFEAHIPYRVALHGYWDDNLGTSMPHLRSLLGFTLPGKKIPSRGLSSLRIVRFYFPFYEIRFQANFIDHMKFLRFICFIGVNISLPSSIGQLYNLQTLDCRGCTIDSVPGSLWKISTLRHVRLDDIYGKWNGPNRGLGKNLQTLAIRSESVFQFRDGWNGTVKAVEEMKEIVLLDFGTNTSPLPSNILSKIKILGSLEILKLHRIKERSIPSGTFPSRLVEIELWCPNLKEDPMHVFSELPKLVVLKLCRRNDHLESMHCSAAGGFPRLKYLKIYCFHEWKEWKVDRGAMPSLCHVRLEECWKLRSIPEELMDHNQLQLLELVEIPMSSADQKQLEKHQKFKVVVTRSSSDTRLSDL